MPPTDPASTAKEILSRCDALARCSEEPGRITRPFLCEAMRPLHVTLSCWMRAAGMEVRTDPIGNLIGRYPGARPDAPLFLIGSHVDTVPDAGRYDGVLGVLLGVAAVEALRGERLPFAVEVIAFSEEEGVRYRTSYLGSKALTGQFDPAWLQLADAAGVSMAETMRRFGLDPARIPEASYRGKKLLGYLEAHIEQGPVLEAKGLPLGVVTAIVGQTRAWLSFHGKAGHAGCLPMELRQDALAAAAGFIVAVEQWARATEGLRATIGQIRVVPGAGNVVPGMAALSLDVRHANDPERERAVAAMEGMALANAGCRGVRVQFDRVEHQPAVPTDPCLTELLAASVRAAGCEPHRLISGAGHDAAIMASLTPMTMLFLRSVGGISHHPDEAVHADDVALALRVMVDFLHRLAAEVS